MTDIVNRDEEHLRLLSIFHYVVAGLTALFACFPIIYVIIGVAMLVGGLDGTLEEHRGCDSRRDREVIAPPEIAPPEPQTPGDPESAAPDPPTEAAPEQFGDEGGHEYRDEIPFARRHRGGPPFPEKFIGAILIVFGSIFILFGWAFAALLAIAGRCLARRKGRTFCFVAAGICCLWIPFGTILGVFTIIVLSRPSVKELFAPADASPPEAA